jgi:hypothetical protein
MARIISGGLKGFAESPQRESRSYGVESTGVPDNTDDTLLGQVFKVIAPPGHEAATQKIQKLFKQNPVTEAVQRTGLRTAARAGEVLAGGTGSIAQAGLGVGNYLSGGAIPTYKQVQEKLPISLPTIENVKEFHEKATGDYLKPKNYAEELGDQATQLITSIAFPALGAGGLTSGAKVAQSVSKIPRAAKIAGLAIGGGEAVKHVTGSELAGEAAKLGVIIASGLPGGRKVLDSQAKKAYETVEAIDKSVTHKVPKVESLLSKLKDYTDTGHLTDDKEALQKFLASTEKSLGKGAKHTFKRAKGIENAVGEAKRHVKAGEAVVEKAMPIKEMAQLEKDANKLIRDYKFPRQAKPYLINLKKEFTSALNEYGETNPKWHEAYKESKDIYNGLHNRSMINEFLNQNTNIADIMQSKLAKGILFPGTLASGWLFPGKTAVGLGALGVGHLAKKTVELGEFLYKSSNARKYYMDATKAALSDNKNAFIQSARKLDRAAQKYEEENLESEESTYRPRRSKIISGGLKFG